MKKVLILLSLVLISGSLWAGNLDSTAVNNLSLIQVVEKWYEENTNYYTITALMAVESSFIPFPSEVVIPPAAYIASKPDSTLNIFLVVAFGTLGALIGAFVNYYLALWLGRPIIYKFAESKLGRLCLLSKDKIVTAEEYFVKHGKTSTLVGRLIPAVRQLISIPAGLARMNVFHFALFTTIGAGLWNSVLALLGYLAQGQQELIDEYSHELSIVILALMAIVIIYFIIKKLCLKQKK
ncbi:MAG: DedA family protein [Paludibacteraceae bacterium]|nr:DedA family protein [Paludibacteraceae bacterium]MED9995449.1 DedA family protein [Paludibacteraceae bacterium]